MHIKSIVSDEDREELERMLSLGFINYLKQDRKVE